MSEGMNLPPGAVFERVPVNAIEATSATQIRVRIDKSMVDQYTEDFQNGAVFPPLECFREENTDRIILVDGFHRHRAAINAGRTEIGCIIYQGGMRDALIYALGCNAEHGFRRSNADKRHAVEMALKDPEISKLKPLEIADICRVTKRFVNKMVNEQMAAGDKSGNSSHQKSSKDKVKKHDGSDVRKGKKLTQEDVELEELRQANSLIKGFPYDGQTACADKLALTPDDVADAEYSSTWLADLVITYRNRGEEDGEAQD